MGGRKRSQEGIGKSMSLGAMLDVVNGLALTYFLPGILAAAVQEWWVALINKPGKELPQTCEETSDVYFRVLSRGRKIATYWYK
jgi:hypothetical protein